MKRMSLSEEEVKLVVDYREQKRVEAYYEKQRLIRESCNHDWEFDFINYKTCYYKCQKCGLTKSE